MFFLEIRCSLGKGVWLCVWESVELLDEFGKTLIRTLQKNGVTPVEPKASDVHNIIEGSTITYFKIGSKALRIRLNAFLFLTLTCSMS